MKGHGRRLDKRQDRFLNFCSSWASSDFVFFLNHPLPYLLVVPLTQAIIPHLCNFHWTPLEVIWPLLLHHQILGSLHPVLVRIPTEAAELEDTQWAKGRVHSQDYTSKFTDRSGLSNRKSTSDREGLLCLSKRMSFWGQKLEEERNLSVVYFMGALKQPGG